MCGNDTIDNESDIYAVRPPEVSLVAFFNCLLLSHYRLATNKWHVDAIQPQQRRHRGSLNRIQAVVTLYGGGH